MASEAASIRKGMCHGCPWNVGDEATETAYNLGCLPSIAEATQSCKEQGKAWACHSEPDKICCGYAAANKGDLHLPLLVDGHHDANYG